MRRIGRREAVAAGVLAPLGLARRAAAQDGDEAVVRRFYAEVLNSAGDIDAIDGLLAPEFGTHDPSPDEVPGPAAYKQRRIDQRAQFAALGWERWAWEIDDAIAADDRVAVRSTIRIQVAGKPEPIEANSIGWFELRDGLIVRLWQEFDAAALLGQ